MHLVMRNERLRQGKVLLGSVLVLVLVVIISVVHVLVHAYLELPFASSVQVCLGHGGGVVKTSPLSKAVIFAPVFAGLVISLTFDALIILKIRRQHSEAAPAAAAAAENKSAKKKRYTVPVHATILSALSFLPYLAMLAILNAAKIPKDVISVIVTFISIGMIVVRCPLTAKLTFAAKARVDRESREQRQEKEREYARKAKEERERSAKMTMQPGIMESSV